MKNEVVQKLLALNQAFYDSLADSFAQSRAQPQPGFYRLLDELPQPCPGLLDVGCGNGRLGHFFLERGVIQSYTGVDFSRELLQKAQASVPGVYFQRDMSWPDCLAGLGRFEAVACLAAMQHIPGRTNRLRLLQEMKAHLVSDGRILLANWQFIDSSRQRRKVRPWAEVGIDPEEVEANDYLLTWQRGGFAYRYVCYIDAVETAALAADAGLRMVNQFRSDGKEGDLSLYSVLAAR